MKKLMFLTIFACFFAANNIIFAQKTKKPVRIVQGKPLTVTVRAEPDFPKNITPEQKRRLVSFRKAWSTLDAYYFDQTFSGLNWYDIKKEFEPRVLAAKTDAELHALLQEMIGRLHRSHLTIIAPEVFKAIETAKAASKQKEREIKGKVAAGETPTEEDLQEEYDLNFEANSKYGIGADLRLIDNAFVISRIEKNSAAENKGLKTGFVITKINNVSLGDLLAKVLTYGKGEQKVLKYLPLEIENYFLNGEKDSTVELEYLDEKDQTRQIQIRRELLKGETISLGKNYPEQYLRFEHGALDENVGYIKFNLFALPVIKDFCSTVTDLKDKKAIIIDLRENIGGILGTLIGLGGMLTDNEIDLGTSYYKTGSEKMTAVNKLKNYQGKIVVLVDDMTISAAEIFAAALQENNRAVVVGEKTAGEALPSVSVSLPTGAVMTYPIANFKTHKGNLLEGSGVQPDVVVNIDRKTLLANMDAQLETALRLIKEDKIFPKTTQSGIKSIIASDTPPPPPPPPPATMPPPVPKSMPALSGIGGVQVETEKDLKDEKSKQIIADFISSVGGEENLLKINSFHINGTTEVSVRGAAADAAFDIFLQKPDKYAEILKTDVVGEVRNGYTEKTTYLQTDYGYGYEIPNFTKLSQVEILAPVYNLIDKDFFKSLKYLGAFENRGRKNNVIQAKTQTGATYGLAFDTVTKKLISYVGNYQVIQFDDYRTVDNVSLPFSINRENTMKMNVKSYELNKPIDSANFVKKENCFDRPE